MFAQFTRQNVEHRLDFVIQPVSLISEGRTPCSDLFGRRAEHLGLNPINSSGAGQALSYSPSLI